MIELRTGTKIWLAAGVTDMRRGFDGLSAQVQTVLNEQPFSGHVFVFRGRRGDIVKVLWFDGTIVSKSKVVGNMSGLAGELFVAAELLKRGLQTSVAIWNAKQIDLLPHNPRIGHNFTIQVKSLRDKTISRFAKSIRYFISASC